MSKRHFLQQAHKQTKKHAIAGQFMSEKLDGQRAFWDGGVTRGMKTTNVPWANTAKDKKIRMATGLWSRYGKPIHAPNWWLDTLPHFPLDGELWAGRGMHQKTRSVVSKHIPIDLEWRQVEFVVFDSPSLADVLYDSIIDQGAYKKDISGSLQFILSRGHTINHNPTIDYEESLNWMNENITTQFGILSIIKQERLSRYASHAQSACEAKLSKILRLGGEGIVLRDPLAPYIPERCHHITKLKPYHDSEAIVIGYITGRKTNKGSKLLGMMGAMIVDWNGKQFEISGFSGSNTCGAKERLLIQNDGDYDAARLWAEQNPETKCPSWIYAEAFPMGTIITFKYRELTDDGIPKEATYLRRVS